MLPFGGSLVRLSVLLAPLQGGLRCRTAQTNQPLLHSSAWVAEPGRTSTAELIGDVLV